MAITTLDGLVGGMLQPYTFIKNINTVPTALWWHSTFYNPGIPGSAVAPSSGLAGTALTSYAGQLKFPTAGGNPIYLARVSCFSLQTTAINLMICDRLWHNSGIVVTTTTEQTVNSVAWPARDRSASTNGEDVYVGLEWSSASTNAAAISNTTINYTNSAGTAGRTATLVAVSGSQIQTNAPAGRFNMFRLQAGDTGIRSVEGITLGTSLVTGAVHLVAYRVLTSSPIPTDVPLTALTMGFPRLYDNTVPFVLSYSTAATFQVLGQYTYAQG